MRDTRWFSMQAPDTTIKSNTYADFRIIFRSPCFTVYTVCYTVRKYLPHRKRVNEKPHSGIQRHHLLVIWNQLCDFLSLGPVYKSWKARSLQKHGKYPYSNPNRTIPPVFCLQYLEKKQYRQYKENTRLIQALK